MFQVSPVRNAVGLPSACEMIPCRLIITRNAHSELLIVQDGDDFQLPMVDIPKWERAAPHLTSQVFNRWGVKAICLFSAQSERLEYRTHDMRCYVLEAVEGKQALTNGAIWIGAKEVAATSEFSGDAVFQRTLAQAKSFNKGGSAETFVRSGWLDDLNSWMQARLSIRGWRLTGEWTQFAMGPWFCLLRCATTGPYIWFKAVGDPNLREYAITRTLSRYDSPCMPEILGTRDDWHGWLAVEACGHHLDEVWDIAHWRNAARSLAKLQLESLENTNSLLTAGCRDLRLERISLLIGPLFNRISELMRQQPVSPPRILTSDDLTLVEDRLRSASMELPQHGLPAALGHADLNPGNVIVNGVQTVFLDWAEATISHPFFTFEYLVALLRRLRPDLECWVDQLREAYSGPWREFYSEDRIMRAFELTPLLAVLAFAIGFTDWQDNDEDISSPMAKLLRALARRMYAETLRGNKIGI
jgi:Phosphotransferase enzyme family